MAIKKKIKVIISIIILIIILIFLIFFIKVKNSYAFDIGTSIYKTINTTSAKFDFGYESNDIEKIDATGKIEYSFEDLELIGKANVNKGKFAIQISKEKSVLAYYSETFEHWVTMDITEISTKIFELLDGSDDSNWEDFPIKELLKLIRIDEIVDVSEYPDKITKEFIIKLLDNKYVGDLFNCTVEKESNNTTYNLRPNMYRVLKEFINISDLSKEKKEKILKDLDNNKSELKSFDIRISITVGKSGYITEVIYEKVEEEATQRFELKLEDFNDVNVKLEDELKKN